METSMTTDPIEVMVEGALKRKFGVANSIRDRRRLDMEAALKALAAQGYLIMTTAERDMPKRLCVSCGKEVDATKYAQGGNTFVEGCKSPDACLLDMTDREAADYWKAKWHTERDGIRAAAMAEAAVKLRQFGAVFMAEQIVKDNNLELHLQPMKMPETFDELATMMKLFSDAILALATAPAGFVCVPVEPTHEMCLIGTEARWRTPVRDADCAAEIYRAMTASHKEG
jgi:hypothetical protein